MQNLRQMLGAVKNKVSADEVTEKAKEKPKPLTFFQRNLPALRSGEAERKYNLAKNLGETRAKAFIDSIRVSSHPSHDDNIRTFFGSFGGSYDKVTKGFIDAACDELNAPDVETLKEDPNYEKRVERENEPKSGATHDDVAFFNILKENLQRSRDEKGYGRDRCHDKAVIREWKEKYHRP